MPVSVIGAVLGTEDTKPQQPRTHSQLMKFYLELSNANQMRPLGLIDRSFRSIKPKELEE